MYSHSIADKALSTSAMSPTGMSVLREGMLSPWPVTMPLRLSLDAGFAAYRSACSAAVDGALARLAARDAAHAELMSLFGTVAARLGSAVDGVVGVNRAGRGAAGRNSGHEMPLPSPADLRLEPSELAGVIVARAQRLACAGGYEAQITESTPGSESGWKSVGIFRNCSHIDLAGLKSGKTYSVRLRGIGKSGPGRWSAAASLTVA